MSMEYRTEMFKDLNSETDVLSTQLGLIGIDQDLLTVCFHQRLTEYGEELRSFCEDNSSTPMFYDSRRKETVVNRDRPANTSHKRQTDKQTQSVHCFHP